MDRNTETVTGSLTSDQLAVAIAATQARVTDQRLTELCVALVDTPSPTGGEAELAQLIAGILQASSGHGVVQYLDERQANAWGRIRSSRGERTGPTVMLYAPIDTLTMGDPAMDATWSSAPPNCKASPELAAHQRPVAVVRDGVVSGLGAMNPKGHAACILMAFEAIAGAGLTLPGEIIAAFGAGGMPTNALLDDTDPLHRRNTGHGVGCSFMLAQGVWADAAIIAKSGWAISHEEVGLAWCDIVVRGVHTYVGARHRLPYRNPINDAAVIVRHLEEWFPRRATQHRQGSLLPQGIVAAVHAGSLRTAAFVPTEATIRVDLRLNTSQSPLGAKRELEAELETLRQAHSGLDASVELVVGIPASVTDPDHWICRTAVDEWEKVTGQPHQPPIDTSGATDANILRNRGIPTVRVGLPKICLAGGELPFAAGMNTVTVASMRTLTDHLIRCAVMTAGRTRTELERG